MLRRDVNARARPSGLQAGLASWSPAVTGRGGVLPSVAASQTCEKYLFLAMSVRVTTNATRRPSGESVGDDAWTTEPMMCSAIVAWRLAALVVDGSDVVVMPDEGSR